MTSSALLNAAIYAVHLLVAPFLLVGFIRMVKARLQNRQGPSVLQPLFDVVKMLRKGETVSDTTTWVFRAAPVVSAAAMIAVALMIPWIGLAAPVPGDLLLVVYLIALSKFATGLAALDTGSAFGALGASREAAVSIQAEPALVLGLGALAAHAHSTSFAAMLATGHAMSTLSVVAPLALVAFWLSAMAELARMPIDDPTTHLELTMIHEALLLENSGRNLAIAEYAAGLKMVVMFGLMGQILLLTWPSMSPWLTYLASVGAILAAGALVALTESVAVKLRWRRIPNLLSFGLASGVLACLIVALKG